MIEFLRLKWGPIIAVMVGVDRKNEPFKISIDIQNYFTIEIYKPIRAIATIDFTRIESLNIKRQLKFPLPIKFS